MINYNWNCKKVNVYIEQNGHSDVVYKVHWIVTGTSTELDPEGNPYFSKSIGTQKLNTEDITDFTPISEVTNEQVVEWTKAAIGEADVLAIESSIQSRINKLITPTTKVVVIGN